MKNNRFRAWLGLLLSILVILGFAYLGYTSLSQIKLGLDLAGGVSITYQAKEENPSDEDMSDTIYKLQQRVQGYSTEAEVYREGVNRINIDIPGVSDANAILEELGKPGSLYFVSDLTATASDAVVLTGTQVESANAVIYDNNGITSYAVSLTFTADGRESFSKATSELVGQPIYIVYDGSIISAPVVRQAITDGQAQIDGMSSFEEAEKLASSIRIGSLSLELEELRSNVVGAKLGQDAIATSLKAALIGFVILSIFMILVYRIPGLASVLSLGLYIGLTLCLLVAFNTEITLTLPGIAGIILSIGMAVDANVIIFTRIKEELGIGKNVPMAIKAGFAKALSAIIDGNITTLFAALVLYLRGSGTVKGFASTLALGIIVSMITAIFITRIILNILVAIGFEDSKFFGKITEVKTRDYIGKKKLYIVISVCILALGIAGLAKNQIQTGRVFNFGIDFSGGTSTNVVFNENLSLEEISSTVVPVVESITGSAGTQTQKVEGTNEVIIKTRALTRDEREALNAALAEKFGVDTELITAESISGSVSDEMRNDAIQATVIATIFMLLYIWFRFKDIRFAAASVLALVHDVVVVIALYAIARWSLGSTFIACILTIVGYSINATIVVFDRIRENLQEMDKASSKDIVNSSISQTLTRSINSSLTTFIMIFVLYILGVSSIKEFALPLMAGIICGTYSSVCLAGTMWYVLNEKKAKGRKK